MDAISRRAEELKELIYSAMRSLMEDEKLNSQSRIQELEQRLAIALENEQRGVDLINSYRETAEAQKRLASNLEMKLSGTRNDYEKLKRLNIEMQKVLHDAFGTDDFEIAIQMTKETRGLINDLRKQLHDKSVEAMEAKELLKDAESVLRQFVGDNSSMPLLEKISKAVH